VDERDARAADAIRVESLKVMLEMLERSLEQE
jgi:predicted nucleotide-binding protein (sugar kinase/HSP70/actin superfamily)